MNWLNSLNKSIPDIKKISSISNPSHLIKLVGEFGIGSPPSHTIPHITSTSNNSSTGSTHVTYDELYHSALHRSKPLAINGRYTNPFSTWREPSWSQVMKWHKQRKQTDLNKLQPPAVHEYIDHTQYKYNYRAFDQQLPIVKPDTHKLHNPSSAQNEIQYTWLGHATLLIQHNGLNILIDPHFTQRAAPLSFLGPQRYRDLPCRVSELPPIHIVCVSHNHYDHLDYTSIKQLIQHSNHHNTDTKFYVPLGIDRWMKRWTSVHKNNVIGLDWWHTYNNDSRTLHDIADHRNITSDITPSSYRITSVPAQHWSQRTFFDRNITLWCGFVIELGSYKLYYSGDTGLNPSLQQIQNQFTTIDCCILPIGAYIPEWFMHYQHIAPDQAVYIHKLLKSKYSIAIHFGTFDLADESYCDAPTELHKSCDSDGVDRSKFLIPVHGHTNTIQL